MIKILIVEDEFTIAMDLEARLSQLGFEPVGIASDYQKALSLLAEHEVDIALLDINLGSGKSGIDLAKIINKRFHIPIIFLSAYSDEKTFQEAKEAHPMGFIIKPFKDTDIAHSIRLALERFKEINDSEKTESNQDSNTEYLFVKDKGKFSRIKIDDILWLEAMDNYTLIHSTNGKHIAGANLKSVLTKLDTKRFVRIHKSHAVAIDKIDEIQDNLIYIKNNFLIISRKYRKDLLSKLNLI